MLPVEVITARSDTMDGVMMVLLVLAFLLIVRATETGKTGWLLAGAGVLGIAFDVKLLESLVALPGLALLAFLGLPGTYRRRLAQVAVAGLLYVVIALAWLTATLIAPAQRPPLCDRLDQRQRLERRLRLQRQGSPEREISRTAGDGL